MSKREKMLAVAVAALVVLLGGYYVFDKIDRAISSRNGQITRHKGDIQRKETSVRRGEQADARMASYQWRSLPPDASLASSLYRSWILKMVQEIGLLDSNINPGAGGGRGNIYRRNVLTVSGEGTLEQYVQFLHRFYSSDYLHRIQRMRVSPIKGTKRLKLSITVEALSVAGAEQRRVLEELPSSRLAHSEFADYTKVILGRNLFGPANNAPQLTRIGSQRGRTDRPVSLTAKATDADPLDKVTYSLGPDAPEGASIGSTTGSFRFASMDPKTYRVTIIATDDGLPPKSDSQTVELAFSPPPDPPAVVQIDGPKPLPSFEDAKFVFVTGITEVRGRGQIWLIFRKADERRRVSEGEKFRMGNLDCVVHRIDMDDRTAEITAAGRRLIVVVGKSFQDGNRLDDEPKSAGE